MSNKTEEQPLSEEEKALRVRMLAELDAITADTVTSWADLYECLKSNILGYFGSPSRMRAEFSLAVMLAFLMAMEEMPEEGDAKVLLKRTNHILVMEQERTGLAVGLIGTGLASKEKAMEAIDGIMSMLSAAAETSDTGVPEEAPPAGKRTLH